ncbi:LysR family transcriptional regulator [Frateuria sp. Soil773]|uniref:transcriptional regulator GcvA n=1 Tax=Frateuria sp. Soil773 TaxID=1736407 RepID=UPI0006FEE58D|nr:transcriptional regulator GcvA [Frateuria sp. Soil773]KRE96521.1 LysR family transcriptional regulator [Frateuria sp. Soil773]
MDESSSPIGRRLPPLAALRAFEAAARHQSFRLAADELAVTATAISHQIRQLEQRLGVALFERQARGVALTAEGRMLFPALREGFDLMADALAPLLRPKRRRIVTVSATPAFVARLLVPRLAGFQAAHPAFDLRLHASTRPVDFAAQQIDAAIRYGRGPYRGLRHEPLLHTRFAPVCSPALKLRTPADLARHPLLHYQWQSAFRDPQDWAAWRRAAGLRRLDVSRGVTFSDETHAIEAAIAGQGVALLDTALVADELARGTLVAPFGPALDGLDYLFVHPVGTADDPAVAALRDWLRTLA